MVKTRSQSRAAPTTPTRRAPAQVPPAPRKAPAPAPTPRRLAALSDAIAVYRAAGQQVALVVARAARDRLEIEGVAAEADGPMADVLRRGAARRLADLDANVERQTAAITGAAEATLAIDLALRLLEDVPGSEAARKVLGNAAAASRSIAAAVAPRQPPRACGPLSSKAGR